MKVNFTAFLFVLFLFIFLQSCDSDDPVSSMVSNISIEVMDVEVNRAYLKIRLDNTDSGLTYLIKLNGNSLEPVRITTTDTIVCLENLTQGSAYKISAAIYKKSTLLSRSNEEYITTLQPSSHSLQYNVYSYPSERGSHEVYDTFIYNKNSIFIGGGNWIIVNPYVTRRGFIYNWNGTDLAPKNVELQLIDTVLSEETQDIVRVVSSINNKIILGTSYGVYLQENDNFFRGISDPPTNLMQLFFYSLDNYFLLSEYNGIYYVSSQPIQGQLSDKINIDDPFSHIFSSDSNKYHFPSMTGVNNPLKHTNNIFYLANSKIDYYDQRSEIVHSVLCTIENDENTDTTTIRTSDGVSDFRSVWTYSGFPVYVSGKGIATNRTGTWDYEEYETSADSLVEIKGTAPNNIFAIGNNGEILHYNGINWETVATESGIHWRRLDVKDNMIAAAGENNAKNEVYLLVGHLQ